MGQALATPASWPIAPTAPAPPGQNYTIPGGAISVSTQSALETELAKGVAEDIKVLNGSYTRTSELVPAAAHRIWCETYNGVTFNYGFRWNNMVGWEMHGGNYSIPDTAHGATDGITAAILNWSAASATRNCVISDVTLDGANLVGSGIHLKAVGGADIQRVKATNFTDYGVFVNDNSTSSTAVVTSMNDLDISGIYRSTRGAADGTAEAGVEPGHKVTNGLARVKVRDCGWSGILTVNAFKDTTLSDLNIDVIYGTVPTHTPANADDGQTTGTAVYVEHYTTRVTIIRAILGPDVVMGCNHEWDQGTPGNGASTDVTMSDLLVRAQSTRTSANGAKRKVGVFLAQGTTRPIIRRSSFYDTDYAGIVDNTNGTTTTTVSNSQLVYSDCDFSGVTSPAKAISYIHPNNGGP